MARASSASSAYSGLLLSWLALTAGQAADDSRTLPFVPFSMFSLLSNAGHKQFARLITTAGLEDSGVKDCKGTQKFTVFAPSDAAVEKLYATSPKVEEFLRDPTNKEALTNIVLSHVIPRLVFAEEVTELANSGGSIENVARSKLEISKQAGVSLGSTSASRVGESSAFACNGIIHAVDAMLIPSSVQLPTPCTPLNELLTNYAALGDFLVATSLKDLVVSQLEGFTLLAPSDAAFAAIPPKLMNWIQNDVSRLSRILEYHIVRDRKLASLGADSALMSSMGVGEKDDAKVAIQTCTGVVYELSTVLIPVEMREEVQKVLATKPPTKEPTAVPTSVARTAVPTVPPTRPPTAAAEYVVPPSVCLFAKDDSCFDTWLYLCEGCCAGGGQNTLGGSCWDDIYTRDRCCKDGNPAGAGGAVNVPMMPAKCAYEADASCFDFIYPCHKCCTTDTSASGTSCWDFTYTKARCCTNVFPAPVYSPPVYSPPVYNPPVYNPPVYNPPVYNPPVYNPPSSPSGCADTQTHCQIWFLLGQCTGSASASTKKMCPVTCGVCTRRTANSVEARPTRLDRHDLPVSLNSNGEVIDSRGVRVPMPSETSEVHPFPTTAVCVSAAALLAAVAAFVVIAVDVWRRRGSAHGRAEKAEEGRRSSGYFTDPNPKLRISQANQSGCELIGHMQAAWV